MAATSYADIKTMSADFRSMLNTHKLSLPFDVDETSLVILVDIATDLSSIMAASPDKLAVIIGLDHGKPTLCILGADSNGDLLADHANGTLDGQETWPSTQSIKFADNTKYSNFFV